MDEDIDDFRYLWENKNGEYILVAPLEEMMAFPEAKAELRTMLDCIKGVYGIDRIRGMNSVIIEDDAIQRRVVQKMLEAGVKVLRTSEEIDLFYGDKKSKIKSACNQ